MPLCRYCLQDKKLINAHIIPASFWEPNSLLITNRNNYPSRRPIGTYDRTILCRECDHLIGKDHDNYAKTVLLDRIGVVPVTVNNLTYYRLEDKDGYNRIVKFFVSVLWRASIATCNEFRDFNLGPYEEIARDIVINKSDNNLDCFSMALCWLKHINGPIHLASPKLLRIENINFYALITASIKIFIKCDKRKAPVPMRHLLLSKENDILMIESTSFPEYKGLLELVKKTRNYFEKKKQIGVKMI